MLVRKTLSLSDCDIKTEGDTGRFSGYASVFGGVDSYGDTILPGAFKRTLKDSSPKMFYNHEWNIPVGKYIVAKEDERGLYVEGELTPGLAKAEDVRAALKHGTLDGLSIGGYIGKDDYTETESGGRIIKHWTRLMEVSPVVFPADRAARIDLSSVKNMDVDAAIGDIETIRDFERFLRDAGGVSKGLAEALVSRAKVVFGQGEPGEAANAKAMQEVHSRLLSLRIPH